MKKLVIFLAILVGAAYVAFHYLGRVGPKTVENAKAANEVLQP